MLVIQYTTGYVALLTKQLKLHYTSNYVTSAKLRYSVNSYPLCIICGGYLFQISIIILGRVRKKKKNKLVYLQFFSL